MNTQAELDTVRKQYADKIKRLRGVLLSKSASPIQLRSTRIAGARVFHHVKDISRAFNLAAKRHSRGYWKTPVSVNGALESKYTPTALSILEIIAFHDIKLERWMMAQVDTLRKMGQVMTLFHCYGVNALARYNDWEARQKRTYVGTEDRMRRTKSDEWFINRAIIRAHKQVLAWMPVIKEYAPPALSAALFFMYPQISPWYCISYPCFREQIMDSGLCQEGQLSNCYQRFKKKPSIQEACESTLAAVIKEYGEVAL